jgi:hypothetical protein
MWALVDKDSIVIDCLVGIPFKEAKKHEVDGKFLVEMTLENSPATLGDYYDGKVFSALEGNNKSVEVDYLEPGYSKHNLQR